MKRNHVLMAGVLAVSVSAPLAHSQTITGSINGTVTDGSGAALPRAKVTATNVETNASQSTESSGTGVYNLRFLQIGQYKVTIEAEGFAPQTLGPFALESGQDAKFDAKLGVAGSAQTVDVTAALVPLLNTESAELGTTLDTHAIDNVPLQGRNFSTLTIFTAGAVATNPTGFSGANAIERNTGGSGQISVNGNRQQANNYLLDGIEINETINNTIGYNPSPDALDQVRVISANAQAEYGNVNGGDVIALLKSGTNQFHGNAFYYVNDDSFNANSWANNLNGVAKNSSTSNIFGGSIGGPVWKDKLFFFTDYSGNRYHLGGPATASVATLKMRSGDFSELLDPTLNTANSRIQLYNSLAPGSPAYANNILPATAISPVARYLFSHPELYPLPNKAAVAGTILQGNYIGATKNRIYNDQFDVKVDYHHGEKDQFFVRYSQSTAGDTNVAPLAITFPTASSYPTKGLAINYVRTINPRVQNEARVGFFRTVWHQGIPADTTGVFGMNGNSILGIGIGNTVPGFTAQTFGSAFSNLGNSAVYSDNAMNNFTYADNLTVQRGAHVIKLGAQLIRYQQNSIYTGNDGAQGNMAYNGTFTARNGNGTAPGTGLRDTGFDVADFYLDRVATSGRGTLAGHTGQRQWRDAGFVQDDWKATRNLTINLGLRWEWDQPIYEVHNKEANLNLSTGAIQLAGVNGNSRALYNSVWTNFMPRVGFSWNPLQRMVVRGGFGSTTYLEGTGANLRLTINPPFQTSLSYSSSAPAVNNPGSSVTAATAFQSSSAACNPSTSPSCSYLFRAWDPNLRPSTVNAYSLTTEYQLSNTSSFQIGYVGEYAYHLIQAQNGNQIASPCFSGATLLAYNSAACFAVNKAPYYTLVGQSGFVRITQSEAMMNYNALQATFRQRLTRGLQFTANYAYSKSMTNSIGFYGVSGVANNSAYAADPRNLSIEYGPAGTDAPNNLNFIMNYELPFGRGRSLGGNVNRLVDEAIGGWRVGVSGFVYSGFPTTLTSTINSGVNSSQQRAVRYRKLKAVNRTTTNWFGTDPSAVPCTTPGVDNGICAYGQAAAGTISPQRPGTERVPAYRQFDASAFKDFHIREGVSFTLRADASNVFNIASYGNPTPSITSATFGRITTTRSGPRQLQLAAKVSF
ncbi:MAG: carboxypeptidase regulatory-like domain-containing protein [Janthinobacterium lividum]